MNAGNQGPLFSSYKASRFRESALKEFFLPAAERFADPARNRVADRISKLERSVGLEEGDAIRRIFS